METITPTTHSDHHCPTCGAKMDAYWNKITPGLVRALVKAAKAVKESGVNQFSRGKIKLSTNEYTNMTKLRFHGLVARAKTPDGQRINGEWLITRRGWQFLRGDIGIPFRVKTFRNRVIDHDPQEVTIHEVMQDTEHFQTYYETELQHIQVPTGSE